jgi:arabinan endo-1,5-alpha-L-arabinosidase
MRRAKRLRLIAVLGVLGGWLGSPASAQLLHRYDFATNANDSVGTAHGSVYGTATISGGALQTTGATGALNGGVPQNCVGLPASAVAGLTNAFSIEVWYSANYNGGYCTLFAFSANNIANYVQATPAVGFAPYQSRVDVVGGGGSTNYQHANQIYCDTGGLQHLVVTYDGTNVTYYLDGTLPTYAGLPNSFSDPGLNLSTLTYIGIAGGAPWPDNTIKGQVHDFRLYGQALTPTQVAIIYGLGANASNATLTNVLAAPGAFAWNGGGAEPLFGNLGAHDPSTLIKDGNRYYVFTTGAGIPNKFSTDLRNWTQAAAVAPSGPPAWAATAVPGHDPNNWNWAPDVAYFNGRYHVYFSISQWGTIDSAIGLFTSPSLQSPTWTDQGKVIQSDASCCTAPETDTTSINCIDPSILVDIDGSVWLTYGSYSDGIMVVPLDPSTGKRLNPAAVGTKIASSTTSFFANTTEGSFLHRHGSYYYLFLNYGGCCSGVDSTYNIRVGRSKSVTGPYLDRNGNNMIGGGGTMVLESTGRYLGPGHPGILVENGTNWLTYHYYDGNANGAAKLGLMRLYWTEDGWPAVTNDWSAFYPLEADAREHLAQFNSTLQNGAVIASEAGRGQVLALEASGAHVRLPDAVANASTFAAWVKWNGGGDWQRIFDLGADLSRYAFFTPRADSGGMRFAIRNGGAEQQVNAPGALPTNAWCHVAVTLDGTSGVIYLNGDPLATNAITIRPWQLLARTNYLGKSQFGSDPTFAGRMDSVRIFGRALSAAEIQELAWAHPALAHRYSFISNAWDSIGMAHGRLMGNASITNRALRLTGASGGYVNLPGGLVSGAAAVTVEFWASFGSNGNWARVFDFGDYSGAYGLNYFFFSPRTSTGQHRLEASAGTTRTFDVAGAFDHRTLHVVCLVDPAANYAAIYTNGVLETTLTGTWPAFSGVSAAWSYLGRSLWSADAWLNATIDELRLYDGRLTPAEIAVNYRSGPEALALPVALAVTDAGASIDLTWPAWALGFGAESSLTSDAPIWSAALPDPVLAAGQWRMSVPKTNEVRIFRLKR